MTMTSDLTIDNFTQRTGFRFRVNRDQKTQINEGTLTREQAFEAFLAAGGLERLEGRPSDIPDSVYLDPTLTLENFSDVVKATTGTSRRFRVSRDQHALIKDGTLTREQALAEVIASKQQATITPVVSATETLDGVETTGG